MSKSALILGVLAAAGLAVLTISFSGRSAPDKDKTIAVEPKPERTGTPFTPFDEAEYLARFITAFEHAYPMTEAYRFKDLNTGIHYPSELGWPVVSTEFESYLSDAEGRIKGIDQIMVIEPSIAIELAFGIYSDLQGEDPFDLMPTFATEPASLAPRLAALAEAELGRPRPACLKIELPVSTVDQIKVVPVEPVSFSLSYTRIKMP